MFELPSAKRVCRDDLKSPESSRAPSPESAAVTYAATAFERAFASFETSSPAPTARPITTADNDGKEAEEEQEFEFRLFRSPSALKSRPKDEVQQFKPKEDDSSRVGVHKLKIRLRSPSPSAGSQGDGAFIIPFRGWDYYFSDPELVMRAVGDSSLQNRGDGRKTAVQTNRTRETFEAVAMDGKRILARASSGPWPGCCLPWRVVHLPATKAGTPISATSTPRSKAPVLKDEKCKEKKKKPGKKRRIALRKLVTGKEAAEQAEKEKRNRKNRERKIKRRQKERDKKAAARAAAGEEPEAVGTDSGCDSDQDMAES